MTVLNGQFLDNLNKIKFKIKKLKSLKEFECICFTFF